MAVKVFKEDLDKAKGQVKSWEGLCRVFTFRFKLSVSARKLLVGVLAQVNARRNGSSLSDRLYHSEATRDLVLAWQSECDRRKYAVELTTSAWQLLVGELINPVTLMGLKPGGLAKLVGDFGFISIYEFPRVDPTSN